MSDEIKPVPPVHGIQPHLPPKNPEAPARLKRSAATPAAPRESDGYDLSAVTPDQAGQLLATPFMQDETALANGNIEGLKDALDRRAKNEPTQQGDMPALVTASLRVASLVTETYSAPRPGVKMAAPTSKELRAKVTEFDALAASFGKERDIMRG
jgi:hypothetical protein